MKSYKVGQLSALLSSDSPATGKQNKKAERLKSLFSTPRTNHKNIDDKTVINKPIKDAVKYSQFNMSISPIEKVKENAKKKKASSMVTQHQPWENKIKKRKKQIKKKSDSLSPTEEIKEIKVKKRKKSVEKINLLSSHNETKEIKLKRKRKKNVIKIDPLPWNPESEEEESHLAAAASESDAENGKILIKTRKRKRNDSEDDSKEFFKFDETKNARTVFVGNLPIFYDKQKLEKLFSPYGMVESTRIRCAGPSKESLPKKVAVIKNRYHPEIHNINGFVVFKNEEMAKKSLKLNGVKVEGHRLRVDTAERNEEYDDKRSIFVGNLPYVVQEDYLWEIFQDCGQILSVRIIRDKETRIGKGFGYVNFKEKDAVDLALNKNGENVEGRPIRISRTKKIEKHFPIKKLSKEECKKLRSSKKYQGTQAKERLRRKTIKNKKIFKNRLRLKRKKLLVQKLQPSFPKT